MKPKLGVLASHPIQYQAPLFRELARRFNLTVFFAHRQTAADQARADFGVEFEWDVDLLSGYAHEFLPNRSRRPDVSRFTGCDTPEIMERIKGGGFDASLVTGWYLRSHWQAIRACRRSRVPVMVRGDSTLLARRSWPRRLLGGVVRRRIVRQFDALLYVGVRNREFLERSGARKGALYFSPHCVDNDWFRERAIRARPGRDAVRQVLAGSAGGAIVLFVGKLTETKRPLDLVAAAAMLRGRGLGLAIAFVGTGPLEGELRELASERSVAVTLLGFRNQTELPAIYSAADLLVLPSKSESWGLVVNEAMACGTQAVTSEAVGCAPDLILPGKTGELHAPEDVPGLAAALERALSHCTSWSAAVAERVSHYSVAAAADGVERAVERVRRLER